jgi:hypothetical protein
MGMGSGSTTFWRLLVLTSGAAALSGGTGAPAGRGCTEVKSVLRSLSVQSSRRFGGSRPSPV